MSETFTLLLDLPAEGDYEVLLDSDVLLYVRALGWRESEIPSVPIPNLHMEVLDVQNFRREGLPDPVASRWLAVFQRHSDDPISDRMQREHSAYAINAWFLTESVAAGASITKSNAIWGDRSLLYDVRYSSCEWPGRREWILGSK